LVGVAVPVLILAVLASVVVRFRRAQGEERQQLKWFTFVVAAELVLLPGLGGLAERVAPEVGALVVFPVSISLIPIAIGVAVLKYRLYDIDRLINRTLVYGLLTALLISVYAGLVFLLGRLLDPGHRRLGPGRGRLPPGRGRPVPAGAPPRPNGGGSALQPAQVQRGHDHRGLQHPAARPGRP
jgi:hypothetical protein